MIENSDNFLIWDPDETYELGLAKCLNFDMFGSQGVLSRLHSLGYRTFDGIIDESYDSESDDTRRWSMAFEQIQILARSDPQKIYLQAKDILEHNHRHICDHKYRLQGLKKFLDQHLTRLILQ